MIGMTTQPIFDLKNIIINTHSSELIHLELLSTILQCFTPVAPFTNMV